MTNTIIIDGNTIYDYFISGAKRLIGSERNLNSINVFPVADGDTGTNLALTMKMIILKSKKNKNLNDTLSSISETAIENAYGNSGMIFAQFLNGFFIETKAKESITSKEFAEVARKAAGHAYNAVGSPKEGTILSVMRDWANELSRALDSLDFEKGINDSVEKARVFVEKTKYKMKVFVENNVVDAGAKAFLIFLEGMHEFLKKGKVDENYTTDYIELEAHENTLKNVEVEKNRYCSQFYIETKHETEDIKKAIVELGDSFVITSKDNHVKIHIHTDSPDVIMAELEKKGTVISQKIEDMKLMNGIIHNRKNKIGIVTDSIADITQEMIDENQITVIPMNLVCDSTLYLDKITMTPDYFYKKLNEYKMNPTSAQPSSAVIEKTFEMLLEHFDSIIGIFVSKKMSGTYNSASKVAKRLSKKGKRISVIDSKLNSNAEGLLVAEAARLAGEDLPHNEIVDRLEKTKENTRIFVSLKDLGPMIKGGRISKTAGMVLSKIKLQPVVSIDSNGKGIVYKKTLSQKAAVKKILDDIKRDKKESGILKYSIVYSDSKEDIKEFTQQLKKTIGFDPSYIAPISPVIGLNSGNGAFAISYIKGGKT
ncbi:MAG: DegV family protein [Eubacteriales bacterium]